LVAVDAINLLDMIAL